MGMFTQVRGVLCAVSIGRTECLNIVEKKLLNLQEKFEIRKDLDRPWVCRDTHFMTGSNCSGWLFIGSEHRNYDDSIKEWLKLLITNINCEGRIEFQYEEPEIGENSEVWIIFNGKI